MSDYQKALKTTFDTIRNVGLAALLLGAAAVIPKAPVGIRLDVHSGGSSWASDSYISAPAGR